MAEILLKEENYRVLGACFGVYKEKGCGFLESVYQECLAIEFGVQGIPFVQQQSLKLEYRGRILKQTFKVNFICFGKILLELKAVSQVVPERRAQLLNYLHATRLPLGLLINFGHHPKLEHERIAFAQHESDPGSITL